MVARIVECELQYLHAGQSAFMQKLVYVRRQIAEIFCDKAYVFKPAEYSADEFNPRAAAPFSCRGGFCVGGYGPIGRQPAKMIYSDYVCKARRGSDSVYPPFVAVCFHRVPVVEGIAPELTGGRIVVGRHARDQLGAAVGLELEQRRVRPHIRGIRGYVYWNIAYYAYAERVHISF